MYADSNVESYEKVLNQVLIGKLLEEMMDKDVKKNLTDRIRSTCDCMSSHIDK